jgi:ABC-type sugar transport system permease subunit
MIPVVIAATWQLSGFAMAMYLAGLGTIPGEIKEAALVDGASSFKRAWHIVLPLISPQIAITVIWTSFSALTGLGVVLALTGGGPLKSTNILPIDMYNTAFVSFQQNQALAIGTFILVINAILTLIYLKISNRYGVED